MPKTKSAQNKLKMPELAIQRSAKRRGCLLSYSQAEPGRELTKPSPRLLAEPCNVATKDDRVCDSILFVFRIHVVLVYRLAL